MVLLPSAFVGSAAACQYIIIVKTHCQYAITVRYTTLPGMSLVSAVSFSGPAAYITECEQYVIVRV